MRSSHALALVAGLLAVAPASAAAAAPPAAPLRLTAVAAPASAAPGETFAVKVAARATGAATRATRVQMLLTGAHTGVLAVKGTLPGAARRGQTKGRLMATVPVGQEPGSYAILVCAGSGKRLACKTSGPLRIAAKPLGTLRYKIVAAALDTTTVGARAAGTDGWCESHGIATRDQVDMTVRVATPYDDGSNTFGLDPRGDGRELAGQVLTGGHATWEHALKGCEDPPDGDPFPSSSHRTMTQTGTNFLPLGFRITAPSAAATSATLDWRVPDPSAGFFDADNTVSNVFSIYQSLDPAAQRSTVPMGVLTGTKPFQLELKGSREWTEDQAGKPAQITHSWTYALLVQRVGADGGAL